MPIPTNLDIADVSYNGTNIPVAGGGGSPTLQTKNKTYTPSTSQQTESVVADSGYDGLSAVNVTVNAMPSGTEGTPVATKGSVSNHSVSVTPSVTNSAGYISGGTKTGTAVSVSASELDSGTKSISSNGSNQDVVGYAAVDVNVPNSYSASDEGKVVSSGALVAQSSQNIGSNGTYDTTLKNEVVVSVPNSYSQSDEGKVVSNGALVAQGSDTVTQNGTVDTTLISSLTVDVSTGGLPSIYQRVEYLQSSGTQYIDTGFVPSSDCSIYIKVAITASGGYYGILQSVSNTYARWHVNRSNTKLEAWRGNSNQATINPDNNIHNYLLSDSLVGIDTTYKVQTASTVKNTTLSFYLFARNNNGTVNNFTSSKLYGFSIVKNNILIMELIPCYRKSDQEPGLYDIVNGVFYTNDGTGTFAVGSDVIS